MTCAWQAEGWSEDLRVFVTGASGHIASRVIPALVAAGHTVTGLARSDKSAAAVAARGATVVRGDLADRDILGAAAHDADGVIHLAFDHERQGSGDLLGATAADFEAVQAIGAALAGSGKPFVGTNATAGMVLAGATGELTELDALPGGPRIDSENAVVTLAEQGVRASVVRLPPAVHSNGRFGFVSGLLEIAKVAGVARYIGDGANRWPSVHTDDAAALYVAALESAPAGSRLHAIAEGGIPIREIAAAVGRRLGVPTASISPEAAGEAFGYLAPFVGIDDPVSSQLTRDSLGWQPTRPGLIDDLDATPAANH
jgi:nucleoside-diphosphate-sugar epimerase